MHPERTEPILPARDLEEIREFYGHLGFRPWFGSGAAWAYEIVSRGNLVVHFYLDEGLEPAGNKSSCYWRVPDANFLHAEFAGLKLPVEGIPRLTAPEVKPWHMYEFTFVDPSGNLLRIGSELQPRERG
jgi:catechol 2,3-dioxygenase-like lactoylglutathione lyase family enzyme